MNLTNPELYLKVLDKAMVQIVRPTNHQSRKTSE